MNPIVPNLNWKTTSTCTLEERLWCRSQIRNRFDNEGPRCIPQLKELYGISKAQIYRLKNDESPPKVRGKRSKLNEEDRQIILYDFYKSFLIESPQQTSEALENYFDKHFIEFLKRWLIQEMNHQPSTNLLYPEKRKFNTLLKERYAPLLQENYTSNPIIFAESELNPIQLNLTEQQVQFESSTQDEQDFSGENQEEMSNNLSSSQLRIEECSEEEDHDQISNNLLSSQLRTEASVDQYSNQSFDQYLTQTTSEVLLESNPETQAYDFSMAQNQDFDFESYFNNYNEIYEEKNFFE